MSKQNCPCMARQRGTPQCEKCGLLDEVAKLRRQLEVAVGALKFYASTTRWEWTTHESTYDGIGCTDFETFKSIAMGPSQVGGKTARAAIKEIEAIGKEGGDYGQT